MCFVEVRSAELIPAGHLGANIRTKLGGDPCLTHQLHIQQSTGDLDTDRGIDRLDITGFS